jgi:hypothetical protein
MQILFSGELLAETTTAMIIACVSDDVDFAGHVYNYLLSELEKHARLNEGKSKNIHFSSELVKLEPVDNEIHIDKSTNAPQGLIKWILQSFLKQDPEKYKDYDVIDLGRGQFTIGRVLDPSKMEMYTCEICGFFTPYSEEIQTHRMTHFGIGF